MLDAVLFFAVFAGFFLLRAVACTLFFLYILPDGVHCPNCNAITVRVQSPALNLLLRRFRTSWCYECNWQGLLRELPEPAPRQRPPAAPLPREPRRP